MLVNGGWREDQEFSECSVTCGGGNKTKLKHCDDPAPLYGGKNCPCDPKQPKEKDCDGVTATLEEQCNVHSCPGKYTEPNVDYKNRIP